MGTIERTQSRPIWFIDNLVYVHVTGEESGGAFSLCEFAGRQDDMPPLHVHHRDDETFYALEGRMTLLVGDRAIRLEAGQAALAPRETPHVYRVESELARWLVVTSPAGFDEFVRRAGETAPRGELPPPGRTQDPAALATLAGEHGIEILGPPGTLPTA